MNKRKTGFSALAIFAIVGTALAVRANMAGQDTLYCEQSTSTTCTHAVSYRIDPACTSPTPCPKGGALHVILHDSCQEAPANLCVIIVKPAQWAGGK